MGRRLTEAQKTERAAKKIEARRRAELGPLFEDQAEPVDRDALLMERRHGWAASVERTETFRGDYTRALDVMSEIALQRLLSRHLPACDVEALAAYRRRTYPATNDYGVPFWLGVLTGRQRVATGYVWEDAPGSKAGRRMVAAATVPPEGWAAPYTPEWAASMSWRECRACRLWHGPGQEGCREAVPVIDGEALDADAEAVLASFRRAG